MLQAVFDFIIFLLVLVTSNVLTKLFPKLPLPLVQVVIGVFLGFFDGIEIIDIEPEIFLAFIIVPLLFREAEEADIQQILKNVKPIAVLILPLVFISALAIGGTTHFAYIEIPLAAGIALGAALAPTDAVVVSSLSEQYVFPRRLSSILKGESLFNDASGLITLGVAVTALTTNEFSIGHAGWELITSSLGGAAIGLVLVWFNNLILTILEDVAAKDTTGYLILELAVPLSAYLLSEVFEFSGIIAVVVAGIMKANGARKSTLFDAQVTQMKNSIWEMVTFILNSIVFIFLGIELQHITTPVFKDTAYSNTKLLFIVLLLTILLFAVRFIFISLYEWYVSWKKHRSFKFYWNDIMLLTFSGSRGTIGIAAILLLPADIPERSLLVFLCATVTGLSFLVGLFIVPLFTSKKTSKINNIVKISILTDVIDELKKIRGKSEKKSGYNAAMDTYMERVQQLIIEQESTTISTDFNDLQLLIIRVETEGVEKALSKEEISMYTYRTYQRYIHSLEQNVMRDVVSSIRFALTVVVRVLHFMLSTAFHINFLERRKLTRKERERTSEEITELYFRNTELILETLEHLEGIYDQQVVDYLKRERLRTAAVVAEGGYISRLMNRNKTIYLSEMTQAYHLERTMIRKYEEQGQLKEEEAHDMRVTVNVMEDYTLTGDHSSFFLDFLSKQRPH